MVLPYCCWGWCSGCRGAWFTTMTMTAVIGVAMAIGMAVIVATVIGKGATIAVIAGRVAAIMTGMAAAMAVVITVTTMTDRDLPSPLGRTTVPRTI